MADATFAIPSFLGGEISQFAQGRFDKPDYRVSLNVCLNAFPVEIGPWTRRPGTMFAGTTRGGARGRNFRFDFQQMTPYTVEMVDGWMRFRSGIQIVCTNDQQVALAISAANPAVVQTTSAHGWSTGNTVVPLSFGAGGTVLQNRQFVITVTDATHFSLADAIDGSSIDGATVSALVAGAMFGRVQELATPYTGGRWSTLRPIQAETTDILLCAGFAPQALVVTTIPNPGLSAPFSLNPAIFNDGPYLDPFINGVLATPNAKTGIIQLTLAFPAYDAAKAYAIGAFVTSGGTNYRSLADQNVGNAPAGSPAWWTPTTAGNAINDGRGFLGSDVGRLVRLFSEPAAWAVGTAYAASTAASPVIVSYNPSGLPGAVTYWSATVASTGKVPGTDLQNWTLVPQGAAIWSWGRITGLSTIIDRALAGSASIGDMTSSGGINAVFNGAFAQPFGASATVTQSAGGISIFPGTTYTLQNYVGKNYSGAADQKIKQATIYPPSDTGFAIGTYFDGVTIPFTPTMVFLLRGKASLPANSSDGTLLGTSGVISNTTAAVTIISSDQVTAWKYVWIEQVTTTDPVLAYSTAYSISSAIGQVSFFSPSGTGTGDGVSVQILGAPLLYTVPVTTWRLGAFSDTTGWPTSGTYDDGRLWLGGAFTNRFDASVSNGITGGTINFAPTDQFGTVAASNAISYRLNAKDANQILWMSPEETGIVMGTQAGEWLIRAPTNGPIAPNNISARRITKIGAANTEPVRTEHTNIFVHRYRRKLTEYFPDAYSGKFTGPNLADKAEHIVSSGIAELAYTSAVTPVIWGRCDDGSLFGVTYKRDTLSTAQPPTYAGWHRHALGSGRVVESVCGGPSIGGDLDALTLVTNGTGVRHVEVLTDTPDENAALADSWYLDDAVAPTSTSSTSVASAGAPYGGLTLNGLWHLNGQTVQVFAGGLDCGDRGQGTTRFTDFTVANGSCFVPFGDGISAGPGRGLFTSDFVASGAPIVVGFTYDSDGQLVRPIAPADTGARNGPALGKTSRIHQYSLLLSNSRGISVGATFDKMYPVPMKQPNNADIGTLTAFSGVVHDALTCDYSYESMFAWRVSRPFPANVIAISGFIQTQDR